MAKLRTDPIGLATLLDYLETKSDFHFELTILKMMRDFGLPCEHGGHYTDPVTKKSREFDIRCRASAGPFRVQLAVECKNLQPYFPLLVTAVQRSAAESFHDVAVMADPERDSGPFGLATSSVLIESRASAHRISGAQTLYREGEPVGKSTTQVGISAAKDGEMVVGDSEVYEKWGQCLSSLEDMVDELEDMQNENEAKPVAAAVLPLLVVPNGTLWRAIYADDGTRIEDPCPVGRVSIWSGKDYSLGIRNADAFVVSHVEVMTQSGLEDFVRHSLTSAEAIKATFFGGR